MAKILGLDLGTNSIGWAIVDDEQNKILDSGVRIFPEGVVAKTIGSGDKEESKNASRRKSRQQRRGFYRKRLRKIKLLRTLINLEMCPLKNEELDVWNKWDKQKKKEGRKAPEIHLPASHKYNIWLKLNPYILREKALKEELTLEEFGRVLYHLIQRRGFLSNRKGKDDGKIYKGKDGVKGIDDTQKEIQNSTLGRYLLSILPKDGEPYKVIHDEAGNELRVRSRYTLRDMYVTEFEAIWNMQKHHLGLDKIEYFNYKFVSLKGGVNNKRRNKKIEYLEKTKGKENIAFVGDNIIKVATKLPLKEFLAGKIEKDENGVVKFKSDESVLYWQRPLRSQKSLLAKCRFEPTLKDENGKYIQKGKTPCHLSHPTYEEYRAMQYINNIEYGKKKKLDESQRNQVLDLINSKDKKFDFSDIKKKLKLDYETFNYEDKSPVIGNYTTKNFNAIFPKTLLEKEFTVKINNQEVIEYGFDRIWHLFHFCEDNDKIISGIKNLLHESNIDYDLSASIVEKIKSINLKEGYSNVSLKAIKNILPYLRKGKNLSDSIILGGVRNAFGRRWDIYVNDHEELERDILKINQDKTNKEGDAIKKIKAYLIAHKYGFIENDVRFNKLYHHSQEVKEVKLKAKIDFVENLRNPIVQQGVNEVKRLVNILIDEHGKFDQIRVELGRDLKNSKTKREELGYKIRENEKKNEKAKELLIEFGLRQSKDNIQKVLLYQEMPLSVCPYTNKTINISDLLGNENKFQIEHIIPKSISLDDSFANKTLCDSKFNGLKGNKTPHDFYQINKDSNLWGGAKSWEEIERRAFKVLPYAKAKRFVSKTKFESNDFIQRQLNDTRYISKKTAEILAQICSDVRVMPGSLTAELRRLWGLNNILQPVMTVDIPNLHVEENKHIPHYVVMDKDNQPIYSQRIYFEKPATNTDETLLSGSIEKGVFKSKEQYIKFQVEAPDLNNGDYWAKLVLSNPKNIVQVFKDRPTSTEKEIVLRGKIEKEKFKNEGLNIVNAVGNENGTYWAKFSIEKKEFKKPLKEEQPKKNGKQILLFGEVKDGLFSSYVYDCEAEIEDGKYWLIIDVDFEKVSFEKALNEKPQVKENQILIQGTTNDDNVFVSDMDNQHCFEMKSGTGKYYVLFDIISEVNEFFPVKSEKPIIEDGQTMVEGTVWVDKYTGEIKFDPIKNREDHRHHAIDALVIALTKESFFQRLSKQNAASANKKRGNEYEKEHLDFPEPWTDFHTDAKNVITNILISHKQNRNILTKITKKITKNGQTFKSEGMAVRGQLHETTFYGKNSHCKVKEVIQRLPISKLKFAPAKGGGASIYDIIDDNIRKLIISSITNSFKEILLKYNDASTTFEEIKELKKRYNKDKINEAIEKLSLIERLETESYGFQKKSEIDKNQKEINRIKSTIGETIESFLQQETFYLPNEGKRFKRLNKIDLGLERNPVPIKKVRIKKVMKNAETINQKLDKYVNPGNNHHVIIYKDENEELKDDITNFWKVVERVKQKDKIYKLPENEDGKPQPKELVLTFQENDMFLLGLSMDEFIDNENNQQFLSNYLFRVQKISEGDYSFRYHLASTVINKNEEVRIASMKKYAEMNPIKVKISETGKISHI